MRITRLPCRKAGMIAGVAAVAVFAGTAAASPVYCGPRKTVLMKLADGLHERPTSVALTNDGQLLEVVRSDNDQAWTILITSPQGRSCVISEGDSWQNKKIDRVVQDPQM